MDYKKIHDETLRNLQEMVSKGKITEAVAKGICADFVAESDDEKIRKSLIKEFKEFKELNQRDFPTWGTIKVDNIIAWLEKQGEQKPVEPQQDMLSQEQYSKAVDECIYGEKPVEWDESIIDETISLINMLASGYGEKVDEPITFNGVKMINNIKERLRAIKPQPKREWSKEDEYNAAFVIETLLGLDGDEEYSVTLKRMAKWLNSLKDRVLLQPKQGWSEEDKGILIEAVSILENYGHFILANKLKSLRPQKQWKPSEEQMKVLDDACNDALGKDYHNMLRGLFHNLKAL